jgi:hypothetical protein
VGCALLSGAIAERGSRAAVALEGGVSLLLERLVLLAPLLLIELLSCGRHDPGQGVCRVRARAEVAGTV